MKYMIPAHFLKLYFFNVHFNIIFPATPWCLKWTLLFRFPMRAACPAHPVLDLISIIKSGEKYKVPRRLLTRALEEIFVWLKYVIY